LNNRHIFLRKTSAWDVVSTLLDNAKRAEELTLCSFAMAEAFARKLLRERNKIDRLVLLLDFTIAQRHRQNLLFLEQVADEIYLCHTHAKMVLVESKDYTAAALISANATMNYRYECGYITTCNDDITLLKHDLNEMKSNAVRIGTDGRICGAVSDH
jgi:hypothetical protein